MTPATINKTNWIVFSILGILTLHLFYTNTELLIAAKEMFDADQGRQIGTIDKVFLCFFALSYSGMTTLCIYKLRTIWPVLVFALLDGFAVYLRINFLQEDFIRISALFYGFYTFYIILCAYWINRKNQPQEVPENAEPEAMANDTKAGESQEQLPAVQEVQETETKPAALPEYKYTEYNSLYCAINRTKDKSTEHIEYMLSLAMPELAQQWRDQHIK